MPVTVGTYSDGRPAVLGERDTNAQIQPPAPTGLKRKADAPVIDLTDVDEIDLEGEYMDANCDQIRRKIHKFLDSGEMKKGEFAKAIGVSGKSLNDFLGQNGAMKGSQSASYGGAWEFFKKREIAGIKLPAKKQKSTAASKSSTTNAATIPDLSGISLAGEASDEVEVFDSCDEIRRKINAHLQKPGVTQAQFCRDLASQLHLQTRKIQSKQLSDFRSKKGASSGNTSIVFYTAYVFFEKLRLAEGRPKTKHRLGMEDVHPDGFDITESKHNRGCIVGRGMSVWEDQYGRVRCG